MLSPSECPSDIDKTGAMATDNSVGQCVTVDPNDIAKCALHHYHHHLSRGKPRSEDEWTIYAAIVAAHHDNSLDVISCATGSKCTTVGPDGWVLRDCHAEVLCKRGLIRLLLLHEKEGNVLEKYKDENYRWKRATTLHLYVSDSPCGDASIYPLVEEKMNFTGAKVLVHKYESNTDVFHHKELLRINDECCVAREGIQELGVLRTKSGRSNLPSHLRSMSMSCSDKILRWCILGMQGSWIKQGVLKPIRLSSIVVSCDPYATSRELQQEALERAICGRVQQVVEELQSRDLSEEHVDFVKHLSDHVLSVHVVSERFPDGRQESSVVQGTKIAENTEGKVVGENASKKRKREPNDALPIEKQKKRKSPCGVSVNWQRFTETEVVVGARGIRQGKKPKSDQDYISQTSRLSRGALMQLANAKHKETYRDFKAQRAPKGYSDIKSLVFSTRPFQGWLVGNTDFTFTSYNGT